MAAREPGWSTDQLDTINAVLQRATEKYGDRQFMDFLDGTYTFADINQTACRLANGLSKLGVKKGQTVVTLLDNSADAVFIWFAINKLGAVSVPVNTALKGDFLRHQVSDAAAAIIIAESDYADRVAAIAGKLPELTTLIYRGEVPTVSIEQTVLAWSDLLSDDTS